tara:strand:+ start:871 stop:1500 length:630 start_codon:yes stop_codon:yes gene_type:complete
MPGYAKERKVSASDDPKHCLVVLDRNLCPEFKGKNRWIVIDTMTKTGPTFTSLRKAAAALDMLAVDPDKFKDQIIRLQKAQVSKPSATNVSTRLQQMLEDEFDFSEISEMIRELTAATRVVAIGKDDEGNTEYEEVIDYQTREKGLKLLLSYLVGQPVQRQEIITRTVKTQEEIMNKLETDPNYRAGFKKMFGSIFSDDGEIEADIIED